MKCVLSVVRGFVGCAGGHLGPGRSQSFFRALWLDLVRPAERSKLMITTISSSPVARVLERLADMGRQVKEVGPGKWLCQCPAHDDGRASLSISEGDGGKVLLYCHAACNTQDVVAAMSLENK